MQKSTLTYEADAWRPTTSTTELLLNRSIDPALVAQSQQYHGITEEMLQQQGKDEDLFKREVGSQMQDIINSDVLLVYSLDFLRKFLAKAEAFIQPEPHVLDITALDRFIRSRAALRNINPSDGYTVNTIAEACQHIGPGTLATMRKVNGIATPDAALGVVPAVNSKNMIDLFLSWLPVNIPIVSLT